MYCPGKEIFPRTEREKYVENANRLEKSLVGIFFCSDDHLHVKSTLTDYKIIIIIQKVVEI